jgi:hypothetical protein
MRGRKKAETGKRLTSLTTNTIPAPQEQFPLIVNGIAINTLPKVKPNKDNTEYNKITDTATVTHGDFTLTISKYEEIMTGKLTGLKPSTYMLLDALLLEFTRAGCKDPTVRLSQEKYRQWRGLTSMKDARKQIMADLYTLYNLDLTYEERSNGKPEKIRHMRILSDSDWKLGRDFIQVTFGKGFYEIIKNYPVSPYLIDLLGVDIQKYPHGYLFGRHIGFLKNMNVGKPNEDILSVRNLIASSPSFPKYENTGRHVARRIIDVFWKNMDALDKWLTWELCHSNGIPLTDKELNSMTYELFSSLMITIHWRTYPDTSKRREERAKQARKKRKNTPKKRQ